MEGDRVPGWEISKGAGTEGQASAIRESDDGMLELSGNAETKVWNFVSQKVAVKAGEYYRLSFKAAAKGLNRENGQNNNCYVGSLFYRGEQMVGNSIFTVFRPEQSPHELVFRVPDKTDSLKIAIFLSMTGTLYADDLRLERLEEKDSFDVLVQNMNRYYSYFEHKKIDWAKLVERHRPIANKAANLLEFEKAIINMLGELKDMHVWVDNGPQRRPTYNSSWKPNFDFAAVDRQLKHVQQIGKLGLSGRTKAGIGYLRINSLVGGEPEAKQLDGAVRSLLDAPGIIIDLRANSGGNENLGQLVAGHFTDKPIVYAKQNFRLNENHDEFYEFERGPLMNAGKERYAGKVCCLIGPGTVSSGEGMAKMFSAIPGVTLIGQPTRGASGNPQPVLLPNGLVVYFSRWVDMDMKGNIVEDRGVQPKIKVKHGAGDPAFARALKIVQKK